MSNSLYFILKKLLQEYSIKVDEKELSFQLQSHPSYPSLHSLTGVLDHFNIQNLALDVPCDIETFEKLPGVFISYIKGNNKDTLALTYKKGDTVKLVYDQNVHEELEIRNYLESWTGVMVAVEKDENIQISSGPKKNLFLKVVAGLAFATLITLFILLKPTMFSWVHITLSILGLFISALIVKHELGIHSKIVDKVCSGNVEKINCDDVLNSKAANLFGLFKLSDLGVIYFASLVISWVLILINQASVKLLAMITVLAIPFTFYSVLYQFLRVKKWCVLCLSIVLVLWLQFGSLYLFDFRGFNLSFSLTDILLVAVSFLFVITSWTFLSPKLSKEQELIQLKIEHNRFKRNYSLFNLMLNRNHPLNTEINDIKEIELGDSSSLFKLVVVTNPLCSHCREVHRLVESVIAKWKNKAHIIIRFNVSNNKESLDTRIALRLIELFDVEGTEKCLNAMHNIYGQTPPELWLSKWGEASSPDFLNILNKEKEWCHDNNINFTPEMLVNGKSYPKEYKRSDLIYFIDEIYEELQELQESMEQEVVNNY